MAPPAPGNWSLRVVAEFPDGARRSIQLENAVTVQAAFAGTDGRRYIMLVTADPARPIARQPATVRAAFVAAESGAPLPEGVTLVDGLPDKLEAAFFARVGVTSVTLTPVGHGRYEGKATLWSVESWTARISFLAAGDRAVSFVAGVLQAVDR